MVCECVAALTDATLLWALNAVDLCYKCDLKYVVHGRGGLLGLCLLWLAKLVCVRWPTKPGNEG